MVEDAILFRNEASYAAREFERSGGDDPVDVYYLQRTIEFGRDCVVDLESIEDSDEVLSRGDEFVRNYRAIVQRARDTLRELIELGRARAPSLFVNEVAEAAERDAAER
jgi:hypothetical protein